MSDALFEKLKTLALERKTTMRALIEQALRKYFDALEIEPTFELEDLSVGEGGVLPGVDLGNWEQMRGLIYGLDDDRG